MYSIIVHVLHRYVNKFPLSFIPPTGRVELQNPAAQAPEEIESGLRFCQLQRVDSQRVERDS